MNFLLAHVAKLAAHAIFLKSTIMIKIRHMFVKWTMKGKECDKSTKQTSSSVCPLWRIFFKTICLIVGYIYKSVSVTTHMPTSPQSYINL